MAGRNAAILLSLLLLSDVAGVLRMSSLFSNNLVLQADHGLNATRSRIYGDAMPGQSVSVTAQVVGRTNNTPRLATADTTGRWQVLLEPEPVGTKATIVVQVQGSTHPDDTVTIQDVVWGDVFLCSGQSNMQFQLLLAFGGLEAIAEANHPNIRLFKVPRRESVTEKDDVADGARWLPATPNNVEHFSALCYLTARNLLERLGPDYPLGLVMAAVGGTYIEEWIARDDAEACGYRPANSTTDDPWFLDSTRTKFVASCYNGLVYPLRNIVIHAILWYQGEQNVDLPAAYECALDRWVTRWRSFWGSETWIFHVQLGAFNEDNFEWHALGSIRTIQAKFQPGGDNDRGNIAMVAGYDLFDPVEAVHSRYKVELSRRMALSVAHHLYSVGTVAYTGPRLQSTELLSNNSVALTFKFAGGLHQQGSKNCSVCCQRYGQAVSSFVLTNISFGDIFDNDTNTLYPNEPWRLTSAVVTQLDADTARVVLSSRDFPPGGPPPTAVGYAIDDIPQCTVFNSDGLPASSLIAPVPFCQTIFGVDGGGGAITGDPCRWIAAEATTGTISSTGTTSTSARSTGTTSSTNSIGTATSSTGTTSSTSSTGTTSSIASTVTSKTSGTSSTGTTSAPTSTSGASLTSTTSSNSSTGTTSSMSSIGTTSGSSSTVASSTSSTSSTGTSITSSTESISSTSSAGTTSSTSSTVTPGTTGAPANGTTHGSGVTLALLTGAWPTYAIPSEKDSSVMGKMFVWGLAVLAGTGLVVAYFGIKRWRRNQERLRRDLDDDEVIVFVDRKL
eukprot:TRINITY_DN3155_c1_g1_i1.p1 TRINITY_DN3155_c1_g1~~TRINITY_DN3155_c1_g1_i1.p1  ORF type:complete len:787 (-),score=238.28 TRINITY_DN3155_c1_g1_i1:622-2982(-)